MPGQGISTPGSKLLTKFMSGFFNPDGNINPDADFSNFPQLINNLKTSSGLTDDDLKPYLDKFQAAGYNVGSDYSVTKAPANTGATPYTPAPPSTPKTVIPVNPNPSDVPGQTIPGPVIPSGTDQYTIEQEAAREKQQSLDILQKQLDLRTGGLASLGDILQKQNQAQFNYDLPNIKEQLQGEGVYQSPSALANAVARESALLGANTTAQLGQYGLGNIDLQTTGLGNILTNQLGLQQGGLQRQFSLADYQKQADLAKQIGATMVPQSPGTFSSALSGGLSGAASGAALGSAVPGLGTGIGALLGAGTGILSGATKGGGTYICTLMKELGILTEEDVKKIHDHLFPAFHKRIVQLITYWIHAPALIAKASEKKIDRVKWRLLFFDRTMSAKDPEFAFDLYKDAFITMWKEVF